MKKYLYSGLGLLILCIACLAWVAPSKAHAPVTVLGHPIVQEELDLVMSQNRSLIANAFPLAEGMSYDEAFWSTPVNGVTPSQKLYETALASCTRTKLQQILALDWGLETAISYEAFVQAFEAENAKREKMLANGEVIYGPKQYTLEQYYAYVNKNRELALRDTILQKGLITDEAVAAYYETEKANRYRLIDTYTLTIQTLDDQGASVATDSLTIDPENLRIYAKEYGNLIPLLDTLVPDQTVEIKDPSGKVYLLTCVSRTPSGYAPFEEVRDNIREILAFEHLDRLLNELLSKVESES